MTAAVQIDLTALDHHRFVETAEGLAGRLGELQALGDKGQLTASHVDEVKRLGLAADAMKAEGQRRGMTERLPLGAVRRAMAASGADVTRKASSAASVALIASGAAEKGSGRPLAGSELIGDIDRWRHRMQIGGVSANTGASGQIYLATIQASGDESRTLATGIDNTRKIGSVTEPQALTAAGICAPYVVSYDVDVVGSVARPVRDSLPNFIADRGGVQFRRDIDAVGSGPMSATGTWTLAQDASPGTDTKALWVVPCNSVVSAEVQAVTLQMKFSNITTRFDPESVAANTKAAHIGHARKAEGFLLTSMHAQATATFTETARLGATRDVLVALDKCAAYVRDSRRHEPTVVLRVVLPHWLLTLFRADITRALHTSNLEAIAAADDVIAGWFTRRNVVPVWTLDPRAAQTGPPTVVDQRFAVRTGTSAIPGFPDQVEFLMYPEGAFVFLDGGTLDVGVVRDQELVGKNEYIQFEESFEGVYRKGVEVVRVVADVHPWGASAAAVATATAPTGTTPWND